MQWIYLNILFTLRGKFFLFSPNDYRLHFAFRSYGALMEDCEEHSETPIDDLCKVKIILHSDFEILETHKIIFSLLVYVSNS